MKKKKPMGLGCLILLVGVFGLWILVILGSILVDQIHYSKVQVTSREDFFTEYGPLARKIGKKYGLYPSVALAQAALESNFGQSDLTQQNNNFFGIKATGSGGVSYPTQEVIDGKRVTVDDRFASYKNPVDSFNHYGKLLGQASRYQPVREAQSPTEACQLLHPCGYSTDPKYGARLIEMINQYHLEIYDEGVK